MAIIAVRPIIATGFGTILVAEINENGIAKIAPTNVPKNAIAIVSNNKYGTPFVVKFNNNDVSGVTIPCKIL